MQKSHVECLEPSLAIHSLSNTAYATCSRSIMHKLVCTTTYQSLQSIKVGPGLESLDHKEKKLTYKLVASISFLIVTGDTWLEKECLDPDWKESWNHFSVWSGTRIWRPWFWTTNKNIWHTSNMQTIPSCQRLLVDTHIERMRAKVNVSVPRNTIC